MIDALEISVPEVVPLRPESWKKIRFKEVRRKNGPYEFWIDARNDFGLHLLYGQRHAARADRRRRRVVLDAARQLTRDDVYYTLGRLFQLSEASIARLHISRVDFAVDVPIPVEWFKRNFRIRNKQELRTYYSIATNSTETLVFGKRPDRYTIYNKVRERISTGREVLQLKECPATRVERQCSGTAVPSDVRTLHKLFENAPSFDPFKNVRIKDARLFPMSQDWTAQKWLMCLGVRAAIEEYGWEGARKEADRRSKRNNILDRYLDLSIPKEARLTREWLTERYRLSTKYQMNVPIDGLYPQGGLSMAL